MPKKSKLTTPDARLEEIVKLRIICLGPPDPAKYGAEFGLQDNSSTADWIVHKGRSIKGDLHFECECRVRPQKTNGAPNFLGLFVHGNPAERFLYLSWRPVKWLPGQPEPATRVWVRRMKVHLRSISWEQIDEAVGIGGVLEARVEGTGRDGGPACASVPLLGGGWFVRGSRQEQSAGIR